MSHKAAELMAEEAVVNSPLRRSSRIVASVSSPAPAAVSSRRVSQTETGSTPKPRRGRRPSITHENDDETFENKSKGKKVDEEKGIVPLASRRTRSASVTSEPSEPEPPRLLRGRRGSAAEKSEEIEDKPKSVRGRRSSATEKSEEIEDKPKSVRGRRSSATEKSKEIEDKPKSVRGRRSSATERDLSEEPVVKKTRRSSVTEKQEVEEKPKSLRGRRSSAASDDSVQKPAKTRRSSVDVDDFKEDPAKKIIKTRRGSVTDNDVDDNKDVTAKSPRGRKATIEQINKESDVKTKSTPIKSRRRGSVTENAGNLEPIEEVDSKKLLGTSPEIVRDVVITLTPVKKKNETVKVDLDLSTINESLTEFEQNSSITDEKKSATPRKSPNHVRKVDKTTVTPKKLQSIDEENVRTPKKLVQVDNIVESTETVTIKKSPRLNKSLTETKTSNNEENVHTPKKIVQIDNIVESTETVTIKKSPRLNKSLTETKTSNNEENVHTPKKLVVQIDNMVESTETVSIKNSSRLNKSLTETKTSNKEENIHTPKKIVQVDNMVESTEMVTIKESPRLNKSLTETKTSNKEENLHTPKKFVNNKEDSNISLGSDGSFKFHLNVSIPSTTVENLSQNTENELNLSKISNDSDKENLMKEGNIVLDKNDIDNLTDMNSKYISKEVNIEKEVVVAKVSNVFKPRGTENSFLEPMDVDESILAEEYTLNKTDNAHHLENSSLAKSTPVSNRKPKETRESDKRRISLSLHKSAVEDNDVTNESFQLCLSLSQVNQDEDDVKKGLNNSGNEEERVFDSEQTVMSFKNSINPELPQVTHRRSSSPILKNTNLELQKQTRKQANISKSPVPTPEHDDIKGNAPSDTRKSKSPKPDEIKSRRSKSLSSDSTEAVDESLDNLEDKSSIQLKKSTLKNEDGIIQKSQSASNEIEDFISNAEEIDNSNPVLKIDIISRNSTSPLPTKSLKTRKSKSPLPPLNDIKFMSSPKIPETSKSHLLVNSVTEANAIRHSKKRKMSDDYTFELSSDEELESNPTEIKKIICKEDVPSKFDTSTVVEEYTSKQIQKHSPKRKSPSPENNVKKPKLLAENEEVPPRKNKESDLIKSSMLEEIKSFSLITENVEINVTDQSTIANSEYAVKTQKAIGLHITEDDDKILGSASISKDFKLLEEDNTAEKNNSSCSNINFSNKNIYIIENNVDRKLEEGSTGPSNISNENNIINRVTRNKQLDISAEEKKSIVSSLSEPEVQRSYTEVDKIKQIIQIQKEVPASSELNRHSKKLENPYVSPQNESKGEVKPINAENEDSSYMKIRDSCKKTVEEDNPENKSSEDSDHDIETQEVKISNVNNTKKYLNKVKDQEEENAQEISISTSPQSETKNSAERNKKIKNTPKQVIKNVNNSMDNLAKDEVTNVTDKKNINEHEAGEKNAEENTKEIIITSHIFENVNTSEKKTNTKNTHKENSKIYDLQYKEIEVSPRNITDKKNIKGHLFEIEENIAEEITEFKEILENHEQSAVPETVTVLSSTKKRKSKKPENIHLQESPTVNCVNLKCTDNKNVTSAKTKKSKKTKKIKEQGDEMGNDKELNLNKNKLTETKSPKLTLEEFANSKMNDYLSEKLQEMEEDSSNSESEDSKDYNEFIDGMAEEGEEDTPSEGSNDIVDEGESVGSTDSEIDDDEYEEDSFICDDEEDELLSGNEFDLEYDNKKVQEKPKKSRIIQLSDNESTEIIEIPKDTKKIQEKPKRSRIIQLSDNESTEIIEIPKKKKVIKEEQRKKSRIITVSDSSSEDEVINLSNDEIEDSPENKNINCQDQLIEPDKISVENEDKLLNCSNKSEEMVVEKADLSEIKTFEDKKENDSKLHLISSVQIQPKIRKSSITITENIKVGDIKDKHLSERINTLVDSFCTTIKKGEISLNLSLEYAGTADDVSIGNRPSLENPTTDKDIRDNSLAGSDISETVHNPRLSISLDNAEFIPSINKQAKKRHLSQSLENSARTAKKRKKTDISLDVVNKNSATELKGIKKLKKKIENRKLKMKEKKSTSLAKNLQGETFNIINQLVTDVKNRPKRTMVPSTTAGLGSSWVASEVLDIKPSTTAVSRTETIKYNPKIHPKDFKNQMLNDKSRVPRTDTKTLLKNKGAYF